MKFKLGSDIFKNIPVETLNNPEFKFAIEHAEAFCPAMHIVDRFVKNSDGTISTFYKHIYEDPNSLPVLF